MITPRLESVYAREPDRIIFNHRNHLSQRIMIKRGSAKQARSCHALFGEKWLHVYEPEPAAAD